MREKYQATQCHNEKQYSRNELGKQILIAMVGGMAISAVILAPGAAKIFVPAVQKLIDMLDRDEYTIKRSLRRLKEKRLVEVRRQGDTDIFIITERGKQRILQGKIEELTIPVMKRWDRKWRVIVFDIPEKHKKARDALRGKLKEIGFFQMQKSCFIHPFECRNEIDFITEFFQIESHVYYMIVETLDGEAKLRRHFSI